MAANLVYHISPFLFLCMLTAGEQKLTDHDFFIFWFGLVLVLGAVTNGISVMKKSIFYSAGL